MEEYEYFSSKNRVEIIAIEEYSDSPNSIYINEDGAIDSYEYENISTIELSNIATIRVENNNIVNYSMKNKGVKYVF